MAVEMILCRRLNTGTVERLVMGGMAWCSMCQDRIVDEGNAAGVERGIVLEVHVGIEIGIVTEDDAIIDEYEFSLAYH